MSKEEYKQYRRKQIAELADWTTDIDMTGVSISDADIKSGSPKSGDKIARNPANHKDRWLVAKDYFDVNFETLSQSVNSISRCPDCGDVLTVVTGDDETAYYWCNTCNEAKDPAPEGLLSADDIINLYLPREKEIKRDTVLSICLAVRKAQYARCQQHEQEAVRKERERIAILFSKLPLKIRRYILRCQAEVYARKNTNRSAANSCEAMYLD